MNKILLILFFPCVVLAATISVSGPPSSLVVSTATAGAQPDSVSDSSTTYTATVSSGMTGTIWASLNSSLPSATTLQVNLEAPTGATSLGGISLTSSDQMVVTGIAPGTYDSLTVTYIFSGTVSAGVVSSTPCTVLFTITES